MKKIKLLAVTSKGGHSVQLSRLFPAFNGMDITVLSTSNENPFPKEAITYKYIDDCNKDQIINTMKCFFQICKIVFKEKPAVIISTGAAPGVLAFIAGKIIGSKLVWIDSIANANSLSLSGKIANKMTSYCYTQWPDLVRDKGPKYIGSVI
ncbi:MAG: UDP-N-acetylglucosamine transferase subunit ALG14 [Colwellia sp.]|nr:UDP-N-acetylglucosamine transferase subunit ALG14 [Colwellia sp.]